MLTQLDERFKDSGSAKEATNIIKRCVHRGFCNGTCPTFIETGEQDKGPRGRIYIIRAFLEGKELTPEQRESVDLCLVCRSCQTTCPASVEFGRLITLARTMMEESSPRSWRENVLRWSIKQVLPNKNRFSAAIATGRLLKPLLPQCISEKIPQKEKNKLSTHSESFIKSSIQDSETVLILEGCAQPSISPNTNIAARKVLSRLGIHTKVISGCCGSVSLSLGDEESAKRRMKRNIDFWWPDVEKSPKAILSLSSACELALTEYGRYLSDDPLYSEKAARISKLVKNIGEIINQVELSVLVERKSTEKVALHTPCSLRHGLEKDNIPEDVLQALGVNLVTTKDSHICCGSGGTYSLLQTDMSQKLLRNKLTALNIENPVRILTSNASCQNHLSSKALPPVNQWIELVDQIIGK